MKGRFCDQMKVILIDLCNRYLVESSTEEENQIQSPIKDNPQDMKPKSSYSDVLASFDNTRGMIADLLLENEELRSRNEFLERELVRFKELLAQTETSGPTTQVNKVSERCASANSPLGAADREDTQNKISSDVNNPELAVPNVGNQPIPVDLQEPANIVEPKTPDVNPNTLARDIKLPLTVDNPPLLSNSPQTQWTDEYDVIVLGTGLKECIIGGVLAVEGKKVLHLDRNNYYGGDSASFNLRQLFEKCKDVQVPDTLGSSRDYNVDLVPKFIMTSG